MPEEEKLVTPAALGGAHWRPGVQTTTSRARIEGRAWRRRSGAGVDRTGDGIGHVLTIADPADCPIQYRELVRIECAVRRANDLHTILLIAGGMARIHWLALDAKEVPLDQRYAQVTMDWKDLATRLFVCASEVTEL